MANKNPGLFEHIIDERADIQRSEEAEEVIPFKYSITSYGADYPVDGLVKRLRNGDVWIPPFQRDYVWSYRLACRFVESLLLGLPVPGIFLSKEPETNKLLVIDGQQRLKSLQFFYSGEFEPLKRDFALTNVVPTFEGRTYKTLEEDDRRRLDDSILHATIIKQDEPSEDQSSIYFIFERLNTGAVALAPQQIRATIYYGAFEELLKELNANRDWRSVYGAQSKSLRDEELILRFLALYYNTHSYSRPMKDFLNSFMSGNRHLQRISGADLRQTFGDAVKLIVGCLGPRAFRIKRALNAAVFDAVMVGVARRLSRGEVKGTDKLGRAYAKLLRNPKFIAATARATADEESVTTRLELATKEFAKIT